MIPLINAIARRQILKPVMLEPNHQFILFTGIEVS